MLSSQNGFAANLDKTDQPLASSKLHVLSTIKPIQALVIAIAGDKVESTQLIPDYASPHNYTFKPSDIARIKQADVIFRIDEHFEILLNQAFKNKSANTPLISLADNEALPLLKQMGKHHHAVKPENDDSADSHTEKGHKAHQQVDLHIWTSPQNMKVLANIIATTLSQRDIKNKSFYEKNLAQFNIQLAITSHEIQNQLLNIKHQPYIVFHNSWQYFSHQLGLQKPIIIDFHEGISAGIKSIKSIREKISQSGIHCLLADPSIKPERVKTITEGQSINTGFIDILGADLPLDNNTAIALLKNISGEVSACLR